MKENRRDPQNPKGLFQTAPREEYRCLWMCRRGTSSHPFNR